MNGEKIEHWEEIPLHKLCTLFPEMNEDEYEGLVLDIKANGMHMPIVLVELEDGGTGTYIIDGQNRRNACLDANVEPTFTYYEGEDVLSYVISMNVGRRHLTSGQLAALASGVSNMPVGGNQFDKATGSVTIEEAATLFNTSAKSVQRFKAVLSADSELAQSVAKGEETLNSAYNSLRPPTETVTTAPTTEPSKADPSPSPSEPEEASTPRPTEEPREDTGDTPPGKIATDPQYDPKYPQIVLNADQFDELGAGMGVNITVRGVKYFMSVKG